MKKIFTRHPHSVGQSYLIHLKFASSLGMNLMMASVACIIHAIFPFLFTTTGSSILMKMMHRLVARKPTLEDELAELLLMIEQKKASIDEI